MIFKLSLSLFLSETTVINTPNCNINLILDHLTMRHFECISFRVQKEAFYETALSAPIWVWIVCEQETLRL